MNDFLTPISPDALLARSSAEIDAIQTAAGFTEQNFNYFFRPLLAAYATRVQQMPLSREAYSRACGAWDFGLVVAILTLRVASTRMFFPDVDSEERRVLEPQCRFAAFAAGLSTGIALVAQSGVIGDESGDEYHPIASGDTLMAWLTKAKKPTFGWRSTIETLSSPECAAIAARFLPPGLLKDFDLRVALMIFNSINPKSAQSGVETTLSKVVRLSVEKALEAYMEEDKTTYKAPTTNIGAVPTAAAVTRAADVMTTASAPPAQESFDHIASSPPTVRVTPNAVAAPQAAPPGKSPEHGPASNDILANAHPVLKEWFTALIKHERYAELRERLVVTDLGIEMPGAMLGMFGLNGVTVKKYMEEAKLVVGRSANVRNVVLARELHPILFGELV